MTPPINSLNGSRNIGSRLREDSGRNAPHLNMRSRLFRSLIAESPDMFVSDDVKFGVWAGCRQLFTSDLNDARAAFFSKGQPCPRSRDLENDMAGECTPTRRAACRRSARPPPSRDRWQRERATRCCLRRPATGLGLASEDGGS